MKQRSKDNLMTKYSVCICKDAIMLEALQIIKDLTNEKSFWT